MGWVHMPRKFAIENTPKNKLRGVTNLITAAVRLKSVIALTDIDENEEAGPSGSPRDEGGEGLYTLYHTISHYTTLHHTIPHYTTRYHTISHDTTRYHTRTHDTTLYHTIPHYTTLYHTIAHDTTRYHTIPQNTYCTTL